MDLKELSKILSYQIDDKTKETLIIKTLANDEKVIPMIMKILHIERKEKEELFNEMNVQLSRAHLGLEKPELNDTHFMDKEILHFYLKNKDKIGHCFKNLKNEELPPEEDKLSFT